MGRLLLADSFQNNVRPGFFDLGFLHKAKGNTEQAKKCITESIKIFEHCKMDVFLKQAKEASDSLK